jgi:hypothetical protein
VLLTDCPYVNSFTHQAASQAEQAAFIFNCFACLLIFETPNQPNPFGLGWQVLLAVVAERFGTLWTRLLFAVVALFPFV